jgi:aryl-alcohol dehydrogenase-like predicted oxidoreductase
VGFNLPPPPPPRPPPPAAPPGVTTFDTSDAFGPSETLIGQFRSLSPRLADEATVITKLTFMGSPGAGALSREMVE